MKNGFKKMISFILAGSLLTALSVSALAVDEVRSPDFGDPIKIIEYVDENGEQVTERIYFAPEPGSDTIEISDNGDISVHAESSGKGWYKKEKENLVNTDHGSMYVTAYFTWGYGDVSVTGAYGGYYNIPATATISNINCTSGTGRYAGVFNKYAYAEYSFVTTNKAGWSDLHTVRLTVSESGNVS